MECFDPAFLRGVSRWSPVAHYGFLMLVVVNLVSGFHALGTLMAVGIMILPAASARFWVCRVGPLVLVATGIALLASVAGLLVSYHADWPTSPAIVLGLGLVYLLSMAFAPRGVLTCAPENPFSHLPKAHRSIMNLHRRRYTRAAIATPCSSRLQSAGSGTERATRQSGRQFQHPG
jgi:hypothetical protein